jgi:hypothetical protein
MVVQVKELLRQYGLSAGVTERTDEEEEEVWQLYHILRMEGLALLEPNTRIKVLPKREVG